MQSPSRGAQMSTAEGIGQEVQPESIHQVGRFESFFVAVGCRRQVECYRVAGRVCCARVGSYMAVEISMDVPTQLAMGGPNRSDRSCSMQSGGSIAMSPGSSRHPLVVLVHTSDWRDGTMAFKNRQPLICFPYCHPISISASPFTSGQQQDHTATDTASPSSNAFLIASSSFKNSPLIAFRYPPAFPLSVSAAAFAFLFTSSNDGVGFP